MSPTRVHQEAGQEEEGAFYRTSKHILTDRNSDSCPLLTKWGRAATPLPQPHQPHQHQWGGMFLTRSQAAAATRSSAPLDAQRRHSAAWSGGTHPPPAGGEAARHGQGWCLHRALLLLLEDISVVFELGPDQRTWTWSRQHRCRSGREETSAEPWRKVKWLSEWVN